MLTAAIEAGANRVRSLEGGDARSGSIRDRWRRLVARERIRYRTWKRCGREYVAPMEPFRVHRIDPREVARVRSPADGVAFERDRADGDRIQSVEGGDWDRDARPIEDSPLYRALRGRFVERLPWEETGYAAVLEEENRRRLAAGLEVGVAGETERNVRYAYLDALFQAIAAEGSSAVESYAASALEATLPPAKRAIPVGVGRDGEFVLLGDRHRFAIARLLECETVPVHVLVRHEAWQARRDRLAKRGVSADERDGRDVDRHGDGEVHPDLEGLASDPLALVEAPESS